MAGAVCHSRKPKCGWYVVNEQDRISVPFNGILLAASLVENDFMWFKFVYKHERALFIVSPPFHYISTPTCLCTCLCTRAWNKTELQYPSLGFPRSCVASSLLPSHCLLLKIKWCFNYILLCSKPFPEPRGLKSDIISYSSIGLLGSARQFLLRVSYTVVVRWCQLWAQLGLSSGLGFSQPDT